MHMDMRETLPERFVLQHTLTVAESTGKMASFLS